MAKQTTLDALAAAADRGRSIETYQWQIEHIRQGVREANAGKFVSAREVKKVMARLRRK